MAEESDGIEEALTGSVRVAVTVGARLGEMLARAREEQLRRAEAAEEQHARELAERLRADQAAARADLAPVFRTEWWDRAGPDDIQHAWTTARAWAGRDPEADSTAARIREESGPGMRSTSTAPPPTPTSYASPSNAPRRGASTPSRNAPEPRPSTPRRSCSSPRPTVPTRPPR